LFSIKEENQREIIKHFVKGEKEPYCQELAKMYIGNQFVFEIVTKDRLRYF